MVSQRVESVPYLPEHFTKMVLKSTHLTEDMRTVLEDPRNLGPVKTIMIDGEPASVIGLAIRWKGVCDAWSLMTDRIHLLPLSFCKVVKKELADNMKEHQLHRATMQVRVDHASAQLFAEFLGFKIEGVALQFGSDKSDYFTYGKVL